MFEKLKERFEKKYVRLDQLKRYVELGVITAMDYETISGQSYI